MSNPPGFGPVSGSQRHAADPTAVQIALLFTGGWGAPTFLSEGKVCKGAQGPTILLSPERATMPRICVRHPVPNRSYPRRLAARCLRRVNERPADRRKPLFYAINVVAPIDRSP